VRICASQDIVHIKGGTAIFTGLIEEVGRISQILQSGEGTEIAISCSKVLGMTQIGDSIAVNGVCLTVTRLDSDYFVADVMSETVRRSNIGNYRPSTLVNLERAMMVGNRYGGHMIQGHVDGVATVMERLENGNATYFQFQISDELAPLLVETGSISINGVSLTLTEADNDTFAISLIPHTMNQTQFKLLQVGDLVNIECDIIGKYLAKWKLSEKKQKHTTIDRDKLTNYGF
jgi:riboflavin synthase